MSYAFYVTKYLFRVLHIGSFGLIFGNMLMDHLFGKRVLETNQKEYTILHVSTCIVLMVSGLVNMILLIKENKYVKNMSYELWKKLVIAKFFLSFALTPILEKVVPSTMLVGQSASTADVSKAYFKIRLYLVLGMFFLSPFLRFFREYNLVKGDGQTSGKVGSTTKTM
jgi:hypothetical protein